MKSWKVFLILGIVILFIGVGIFIAGFAAGGWNFSSDLKMQTFTSEADNSSLDLSLSAGEMNVEFYDGENIEVDYPTAYPYRYNVTESDGKISVSHARNSFGVFNWFRAPKVTVRIPRGKVINLKLDISAGTAKINDGEFGTFNLDISAGYVSVGNIKCTAFTADVSAGSTNVSGLDCDKITVDLSAGSANIRVNGKKSDYTITVDKSAGSCNVGGQQGTVAGKIVNVDISAGSVSVSFTD